MKTLQDSDLVYVDPVEALMVFRNMAAHGGGFIKGFATAALANRPDWQNTARIKQGFPDLWEKYLNWPMPERVEPLKTI